jgi:peroxiredoxin family protein
MNPSLVVFLHSHRYDRLYQAASIVLTASAMGWPCHVFLFHGALASYIAGTWDEPNIQSTLEEAPGSGPTSPGEPLPDWAERLERGFEAGNFRSLYGLLEKAASESGGLKILACSTSCRLLELDTNVVREKVNEIVGLPTMIQIAADAKHALYI